MVFAHELGHNANHHVADKIQNANTGALVGLLLGIAIGANPADAMDLGANIGATSYSIDYENEADYLSIYILALSGYDISKAPNFWRRFAVEVPNSIYSGGGTHPSTSERFVRLETYVKEVQDQIDKGLKPVPKYKKITERNIPSIEFPALRLADPINFYPTSFSSWRKKIKLNI